MPSDIGYGLELKFHNKNAPVPGVIWSVFKLRAAPYRAYAGTVK